MYYTHVCLNCTKMMVLEAWVNKSCDCGGVFVSREVITEAYHYLTGSKEVLPLNGAELAREFVRIGAAIKYKHPKAIVTNVKSDIDKEGLLWVTVEFDYNPFGAQRHLIGRIEPLPEIPEWLKEFTDADYGGGAVEWNDPDEPEAFEGTPDWMEDLNCEDDDEEVEEVEEEVLKPGDCAGPPPKFGEPGWLRYLIFCPYEEEEDTRELERLAYGAPAWDDEGGC